MAAFNYLINVRLKRTIPNSHVAAAIICSPMRVKRCFTFESFNQESCAITHWRNNRFQLDRLCFQRSWEDCLNMLGGTFLDTSVTNQPKRNAEVLAWEWTLKFVTHSCLSVLWPCRAFMGLQVSWGSSCFSAAEPEAGGERAYSLIQLENEFVMMKSMNPLHSTGKLLGSQITWFPSN